MDKTTDINTIFQEKVQHFDDKIKELEDAEKTQDEEIDQLKHSILRLNKLLETLKSNKALTLAK